MQIVKPVLAQGICNPALPWLQCGEGGGSVLGNIISALLGLILIIAGLLSFFYLIQGGIQWITSGGDKNSIEASRNRIIHAVIGLIMVASTWAVMTLLLGKFLGMSFPNIKIPFIGGTAGGDNGDDGNSQYLATCPCRTAGQCATVNTLSYDNANNCKKCTTSGWINNADPNACIVGGLVGGNCGPCQ